jgi:hypothetical protein
MVVVVGGRAGLRCCWGAWVGATANCRRAPAAAAAMHCMGLLAAAAAVLAPAGKMVWGAGLHVLRVVASTHTCRAALLPVFRARLFRKPTST